MSSFIATVGLEVHVELKTKSKMFCGCANNPHNVPPNTNICPVCLAHPGTLPVPNYEAIKQVLTFGVAVGGTLANYSEFDRKNYFYPDIPKAYQLSQHAFPFVTGGVLHGVALTRVHLEEDTARSQHDKGSESLVDYNRAGVPLMELVTEPVIHDATTAGNFARELQLLLRTLRISDANLERGEMRIEANISVSNTGQLGTKVEVKNLNSFKSVEAAIDYEVKRQEQLIKSGEAVKQETRGWDEQKLETYLQRSKETAKDYRYFPEPDIPNFLTGEVAAFQSVNLAENLPLLPSEKRLKYSDLGLTNSQIETVMQSEDIDSYAAKCFALTAQEPVEFNRLVVNYLLTDVAPHLNFSLSSYLTPTSFVSLMKLVAARKVTSRVAKDLLLEFINEDTDLVLIAESRHLLNNLSATDLLSIVSEVLQANSGVVAEYKSGKLTVLQFLLGQVMRATKGSADPEEAKKLLIELLTQT